MMQEQLIASVQGEMTNLAQANTAELGAAIDMIKDLSEAVYYCTIVESMEESDEKKEHNEKYYRYPLINYGRDMDRGMGRMYYEEDWDREGRNPHEGQSHLTRKTYMERKMHGGDKAAQMHELEKYMQDLGRDLTEMIEDASVEEKQLLQKKLTTLATKIV